MMELLRAWFERRRALHELRAIEGQGGKDFSTFFAEQIDLAKREVGAGRTKQAFEIWSRMHEQFPNWCLTSESALSLFIDLGSHDEAEALILEARGRYPRYRSVYDSLSARVASRRGDHEQALRQYEIVRRNYPWAVDGYSGAANCMIYLGRHEEAATLLRSGVRKFPYDIGICYQYAQLAMRSRDWFEGLRRWNLVAKRFDYSFGLLGVAQCMKEMGRLAEAETVLIEACARFTMDAKPFADLASLSSTREDVDEAVQRWEVVLQRFPGFEPAYVPAAEALRKAGREADADQLLCIGMTRSPDHLPICLECARSAHRRADWAAAGERWRIIRNRFPACAEAREQETVALAALERQTNSAPN